MVWLGTSRPKPVPWLANESPWAVYMYYSSLRRRRSDSRSRYLLQRCSRVTLGFVASGAGSCLFSIHTHPHTLVVPSLFPPAESPLLVDSLFSSFPLQSAVDSFNQLPRATKLLSGQLWQSSQPSSPLPVLHSARPPSPPTVISLQALARGSITPLTRRAPPLTRVTCGEHCGGRVHSSPGLAQQLS